MNKVIKYLTRVWFDLTKGRLFYYGGKPYTIKNEPKGSSEVYIDLNVPSLYTFKSEGWENDLINHVLDNFKGTDMKMIKKVEY